MHVPQEPLMKNCLIDMIAFVDVVASLQRCEGRKQMGLFNAKTAAAIETRVTSEESLSTIQFDKPKVLLVDLDSSASDALIKSGFNLKEGTFGTPYRVDMGSHFEPLISQPLLPNFAEQEIVVVDLHYEVANKPIGKKARPDGELDFWGKCDYGFIDPRQRAVAEVREAFDRILDSGGVFVVFAADRTPGSVQIARKGYRGLEFQDQYWGNEWHFLSEFQDMEVRQSRGEEMSVLDQITNLEKLIKSHLAGSLYDCTLKGGSRRENSWTPLIKNKFGHAVGLIRSCPSTGLVIVLPQLKNKAEFLKSLFTEVLPELAPHLFPGIEKGKWTHLPAYELPAIVQLQDQRSKLEVKFQADLAALEEQVFQARKQNGWIHDLLTQTGDPLVVAVEMGLKTLGFNNVVDMDKVRDKEGKSRREDLQIQDTSPTLVVDIKGIANFPTDEDVLQADKHATLLMREQSRTDIFGLSLVNHQRHIPPLQRDNEMPFRQELIDVALERKMGLLTAWDFYRLVRNAQQLQWKFEYVRPILYTHGRIEIIPTHYTYLGTVTKVWTNKFGIDIESGSVAIGWKIAVEFDILFEVADVEGLMVNNNIVQVANTGDKTGLPWPTTNSKLREGLRVFCFQE